MNKTFLVAWIALFVAWMAGSFVVHGTLLYNDYAALPNLFRPPAEAEQHMAFMLLAHVIMAGAFTWIYARVRGTGDWMPQGIQFGIAAALMTVVPTYMIYYVVQPMPAGSVIKQILFDGALVVILGMLVAFFYRKPASA
ncbi:MAG: hypothetical protein R2729_18160 [Bryobacteraceae bacterium]